MLMAPVIDLKDCLLQCQALDTLLKRIKQEWTGSIQRLIINTDRQDKVTPLTLRDLLAPRHLLACLERATDILQEVSSIPINKVIGRHIGIEESQRITLLGRKR